MPTPANANDAYRDQIRARVYGSNTIQVDANQVDIQAAIDSITDNLEVIKDDGTALVTNGSAQISFSASPAGATTIYAGIDLFYDVLNDRYYEILEGPTITDGSVYNLNEVYQGTTDAVFAGSTEWQVVRPNPYKILVNPGVAEITTDITAITTKPFVHVAGIDRNAVIIRRMTSGLTPLFAIAHGSVVSGITVECPDSLFEFYRMGLTGTADTSQTEAMKQSKWVFRDCNFNCIDPTGIDSGSDMYLSPQYYNDDKALFDVCNFKYSVDGFTIKTEGAGRVELTFNKPVVTKHRSPAGLVAGFAGGSFMRAGFSTGADDLVDLIMFQPRCDQISFCGPENPGQTFGGNLGEYGFCFVGNGATGKIIDPYVELDFGSVTDSKFRGGVVAYGDGDVLLIGGYINLANTGTVNGTSAAIANAGTGTFEVVSDGK